MAGAIDIINVSLRMRTRGGGVEPLRTPCVQGEGSENSDFGAYVLNGRPHSTYASMGRGVWHFAYAVRTGGSKPVRPYAGQNF